MRPKSSRVSGGTTIQRARRIASAFSGCDKKPDIVTPRNPRSVTRCSIAGRKVYPDHTVYCGTKFFVHAISESLREYLSDYDVRVIVLSPGVIETEVLSGVLDQTTLANYKANKAKMGGGIGPEHVANIMLHAYRMPQNALIQEIAITPTRQKY